MSRMDYLNTKENNLLQAKIKFMRREEWFLAPEAPFSELLPLDKYIA
jgi:hypothetical protein